MFDVDTNGRTINGSNRTDLIFGTLGNDVIHGGDYGDTIRAGAGNDVIRSQDDASTDNFWGEAGSDTFDFQTRNFGNDIIRDFTVGVDKIDLSALFISDLNQLLPYMSDTAQGVLIDTFYGYSTESITLSGVTLAQLSASDFVFDVDFNGRTITGTSRSDLLFGTIGDDTLNGLSYSDTIHAGDGNDVIDGGDYGDTLTGGRGSDTFIMNKYHSDGDVITDFTAADTLQLNYDYFAGQGEFTGRAWEVRYVYQNGDTIFYVDNDGDGTYESNEDTFTILGVWAPQSGQTFYGTFSADVITGTSGDDTIYASDGDDEIDAGGGDDLIRGGYGSDTMTGGFGDDIFVQRRGQVDGDVITDFSISDTLQTDYTSFIGKAAFTGGFYELRYQHVGANTVFYADFNGDMIADESFTILGQAEFTGNPNEITMSSFRDFGANGTSDILFQLASGGNFYRQDDPASALPPSNEGRPNHESYGFADLNADGILDHVVKTPAGYFAIQYDAENSNSVVIPDVNQTIIGFADLDGDGADEALSKSTNPNNKTIYLYDEELTVRTNAGTSDHSLIGFGDFDGDGIEDALLRADFGVSYHRIYNAVDGPTLIRKANFDAKAIGDFNGDGLDDVLTENSNNSRLYILEGDEAAPLATQSLIGFQDETVIATGDFDNDGKLDALVRNDLTNSYSTLTNGLTVQNILDFVAYELEAIGDFNGDGDDDILFRLPNDNGRIVFSGALQSFAPVTDMSGQTVKDIADYDGDGNDDILVSHNVTGAFSILPGGNGNPIALAAVLNGADVISPNGLDTLNLSSVLGVASVSNQSIDPMNEAFSRPQVDLSDESFRHDLVGQSYFDQDSLLIA